MICLKLYRNKCVILKTWHLPRGSREGTLILHHRIPKGSYLHPFPSQLNQVLKGASTTDFNAAGTRKSCVLWHRPDLPWDTPNLLFSEYRLSFPEVKRPQREVDYSPPSSADVKNKWSSTSAPLSVYMVWRGISLPAILRDLSVWSFVTLKGYILNYDKVRHRTLLEGKFLTWQKIYFRKI